MTNPLVALPGGDKTKIQEGYSTAKGWLSFIEPVTIATAQIDQGVFDHTLAQITVDNTSAGWSDVETDMLAFIGTTPGAYDVHVGRVRKVPGATTLYLGQFSQGDPGYVTTQTTVALANNQYITIVDMAGIFSVFSRITLSGLTPTFLKSYDRTWDNETGSKPAAVLNIGEHHPGWVDTTTGVLTDSRTAALTLFDGSTATYLWDIADGTLEPGYALTDPDIIATYPPGERWVKCTSTLTNGRVITAKRRVWAYEVGTFEPLEVQVSNLRKMLTGATIDITLLSDFEAILRNGTLCVFWQEQAWNGQDIPSAVSQVAGFAQQTSFSIDPIAISKSFSLVSPLTILEQVKGFSQILQYAAAPANWQESSIMHLDFAAHYLLAYQTNILDLFDFNTSGLTSYTRNAWQVEEGNYVTQINRLLDAVDAQITQLPNGAAYILRDPILLPTAARNALVERLTIEEDDIKEIQIERVNFNRVGMVKGSAFTAGTGTPTPMLSDAYGTVSGQGGATGAYQNKIAINQSELNIRSALKEASENNPYPTIRVTLVSGGYDVIEPALRYWVRLSISDTSLTPEGAAINWRCVCTEVSIAYQENGTRTITLTLIAETNANATPGETVPVPAASLNYDPTTGLIIPEFAGDYGFGLELYDSLGKPAFTMPPTDVSGSEPAPPIVASAIAWNAKGVRTGDYTDGSPNWAVSFNETGETLAMIVRLSGNQGLAITEDGIYYNANLITGAFALKQALKNLDCVRYAEGVGSTAAGATSNLNEGTWAEDFDFTVDDFAEYGWTIPTTGAFGAGNYSVYSAGNGYQHNIIGGSRAFELSKPFTVDCTVTSIRLIGTYTNPGGADGGGSVNGVPFPALSGGAYDFTLSVNITLADTGFLIVFGFPDNNESNTLSRVVVSGTGVNPFKPYRRRVRYSTNGFTSVASNQAAGVGGLTDTGDGYDIDSFALGVHLVEAEGGLSCTSSYTGTPIPVTGLSMPSSGKKIRACRIPLEKQDGTDNNDKTALEIFYATDTTIGGYTLFRATLNANTGVATGETGISTTISGTTYCVVEAAHGNQFETYGGDAERILAWVEPVGGGAVRLIGYTDGSTPVSINTGFTGSWVQFLEPGRGGDGSKIMVAGSSGVRYSDDFGTTLSNATGDLNAETGSGAATGAFRIQ